MLIANGLSISSFTDEVPSLKFAKFYFVLDILIFSGFEPSVKFSDSMYDPLWLGSLNTEFLKGDFGCNDYLRGDRLGSVTRE